MTVMTPLLQELTAEAATTRRVLERVPEASLTWRPHEKSMSLAQLALHVATLPRMVSQFVAGDTLDVAVAAAPSPTIATHDALMAAFDASISHAQEYLASVSDARAMETWTLFRGETVLMAAPRAGVIRSLLFNHWYHHRGQLVVYLRLLNVPVPSVYGPTADENPFA